MKPEFLNRNTYQYFFCVVFLPKYNKFPDSNSSLFRWGGGGCVVKIRRIKVELKRLPTPFVRKFFDLVENAQTEKRHQTGCKITAGNSTIVFFDFLDLLTYQTFPNQKAI